MQTPLRTFWLDDRIEEMQQATAAFLTDRYYDGAGAGAYVATLDDVAELQKATAAFLAERTDGDCFCLDGAGNGLLLPGEQYLLPVSVAVELARAGPVGGEDLVSLIDELLYEQMDYEDVTGTVLVDAASAAANVSEVEYTSFDEVLGPNCLPNTPPIGGRTAVSFGSESTYVISEGNPNLPIDVDQLFGIGDDTNNDESDDDGESSVGSGMSIVPLGAHSVLSHSQASYAASFFDPDTLSMVPYVSLDGLLSLDKQYGGLSSTLRDCNDEDSDDEGEDLNFQYTNKGDYSELLDNDDEPLDIPTTQIVRQDLLKIDTNLSPITEEHEPYSTASDCSMDFADCHGFLKPLVHRQQDFLDKDTCVGDLPSDLCEEVLEVLDGLFADGIWEHELDLEVGFANDIWTNEQYLEMAFSS